MDIEELRKESKGKIDDMVFATCWECNPAHEHMKKEDYVISCFGCGRYFYKGIDITIYEKKKVIEF